MAFFKYQARISEARTLTCRPVSGCGLHDSCSVWAETPSVSCRDGSALHGTPSPRPAEDTAPGPAGSLASGSHPLAVSAERGRVLGHLDTRQPAPPGDGLPKPRRRFHVASHLRRTRAAPREEPTPSAAGGSESFLRGRQRLTSTELAAAPRRGQHGWRQGAGLRSGATFSGET